MAWNRVLPSTQPGGGEPLRLENVGAIFFTVDTDGSVLAATLGPSTAYDCDLISGACEKYADVPPGGGDPQFPGTDM